jgi:hypothetical protein
VKDFAVFTFFAESARSPLLAKPARNGAPGRFAACFRQDALGWAQNGFCVQLPPFSADNGLARKGRLEDNSNDILLG